MRKRRETNRDRNRVKTTSREDKEWDIVEWKMRVSGLMGDKGYICLSECLSGEDSSTLE